jgi:hypothetical protein
MQPFFSLSQNATGGDLFPIMYDGIAVIVSRESAKVVRSASPANVPNYVGNISGGVHSVHNAVKYTAAGCLTFTLGHNHARSSQSERAIYRWVILDEPRPITIRVIARVVQVRILILIQEEVGRGLGAPGRPQGLHRRSG